MGLDTVVQLEKLSRSSNCNNTPSTSAPHAERYPPSHLEQRKETLLRHLEVQSLQDHLRRRGLRVRHQRRHHCQGHHEQAHEAQGRRQGPGSSREAGQA